MTVPSKDEVENYPSTPRRELLASGDSRAVENARKVYDWAVEVDEKKHHPTTTFLQTTAIGRAPGRVEILGNHTDYNDGFVLSAGVQMQCRVVMGVMERTHEADNSVSTSSSPPCELSVYSASFPELGIATCTFSDVFSQPFENLGLPGYCKYICGVFVEFFRKINRSENNNLVETAKLLSKKIAKIQVYVESDVPLGAAVSSSAALEVSTAVVLEKLFASAGESRSIDLFEKSKKISSAPALTALEVILLCKKAENDYVGMGCGILDQFSSHQAAQDTLLLLDCRYPMENLKKIKPSDGGFVFVIANTGVKHALVDGQYDKLKRLCYEGRDSLKKAIEEENKQNTTTSILHLRDVSSAQFEKFKEKIPTKEARDRAQHAVYENERVLEAAKLFEEDAEVESRSKSELDHASSPSKRRKRGEVDGSPSTKSVSVSDKINKPLPTTTTSAEELRLKRFGQLMHESHKSSQFLFQNSCAELDKMVELALTCPGCLGARLM
ncbi:unnamed protein product, partial [Amoebophrya sp. A120]|eukprot:GSA120T00023324001.1